MDLERSDESSASALWSSAQVFRTPGWAENFGGRVVPGGAAPAGSSPGPGDRSGLRRPVLQPGAQHRSVFNKLYETETLAGILDAQYRDDYQTRFDTRRMLSAGAGGSTSGDGARRHDPVWLGVQVTDTSTSSSGR